MTGKLNLIYKKLYSRFGPQYWWPGDSPFEVMIGAILTQNTNWQNAAKAINNLKRLKLLKPRKLYLLPQDKLAKLIRPAGYYNIKAGRLKDFLNFLFKYYQGNIKKMSSESLPELRQKLLAVKGIGPETADSMLLYALDKPIFVVDAYTLRILSRHRLIKEDATYQEVQDLFMKYKRKSVRFFNEYHALIVRLGKDFCLKTKPRCLICPLTQRFSLNN